MHNITYTNLRSNPPILDHFGPKISKILYTDYLYIPTIFPFPQQGRYREVWLYMKNTVFYRVHELGIYNIQKSTVV